MAVEELERTEVEQVDGVEVMPLSLGELLQALQDNIQSQAGAFANNDLSAALEYQRKGQDLYKEISKAQRKERAKERTAGSVQLRDEAWALIGAPLAVSMEDTAMAEVLTKARAEKITALEIVIDVRGDLQYKARFSRRNFEPTTPGEPRERAARGGVVSFSPTINGVEYASIAEVADKLAVGKDREQIVRSPSTRSKVGRTIIASIRAEGGVVTGD